jgi:hypothetical protein
VRFIADTRRRRNEIFILIEEVVMDRFIAQSGMRNVIFQTDNNNVIKIVKSTKKTVLNFSNPATCLVLFLQVVGVVRVYNFIHLTVGGYPTTCYSNYSVESDRRDRIHQNVPKKRSGIPSGAKIGAIKRTYYVTETVTSLYGAIN